MRVGTIENGMLFVLEAIACRALVTLRGSTGSPSCCFKTSSVNTKSEASYIANNAVREIKKHVFGKTIRGAGNQGPVSR